MYKMGARIPVLCENSGISADSRLPLFLFLFLSPPIFLARLLTFVFFLFSSPVVVRKCSSSVMHVFYS